MSKQTPKELATKTNSQELALPEDLQGAWGAEEADSTDVIIPKLLLVQGSSKLVSKGKAQVGDLILSTTGKVLGGRAKPVTIIPFDLKKTYVIMKKVDGQFQFEREDEYHSSEGELPWDFEENGFQMQRQFAYNFYCFIVGQDNAVPTRLQFKSTSRKSGRIIANHFATCRPQRIPPCTKAWDIGSEIFEGEKNTWQLFTVTSSNYKVKVEEIKAAKKWYNTINAGEGNIKHDDTEEVISAGESGIAAPPMEDDVPDTPPPSKGAIHPPKVSSEPTQHTSF